jgi:2-dehydropantoate 2-reductase
MKVLVVGAGAVGQVYGQALQAGGAELVFFARPRYRDALADPAGLPLRVLNRARDQQLLRWRPDGVISTMDEVRAQRWDAVWLCVSSPALQLPWFDELAQAVGEATVVSLQPGLIDPAWMHARVPPERLVLGMIPYIAWTSPLPGQVPLQGDPAMTVWHPPFSATPLSGPLDGVTAAAGLLRAGGLRARVVGDATAGAGVASAVLLSTIAALEAAGWSLARLRSRTDLRRAVACKDQAVAIAARFRGVPVPRLPVLLRPWMLRILTLLAPLVVPFPLEAYLRAHFTKVGEQTRQSLRTWRQEGEQRGMDVDAIAAMEAVLAARDAAALPSAPAT